jgi:protein SCO1/2
MSGTRSIAQPVLGPTAELRKIDVLEQSGDTIPLNLSFVNEHNQTVQLYDYFKTNRPVILTLAYYECPMLCTFVLNGLTRAVNAQSLTPGKDFIMLTLSIDPQEKPDLAAAKKKNYTTGIKNAVNDSCWTFLVGQEQNIEALAKRLGFIYYYDEQRKEYAHPAAVFILSDKGVISRYLYGIEFKPQDLRLALLEAGKGKIGNTIDRFILYCYHYDPDRKGYVIFAGNVMRLGGVITVLTLVFILTILWRKESGRKFIPGPVNSGVVNRNETL